MRSAAPSRRTKARGLVRSRRDSMARSVLPSWYKREGQHHQHQAEQNQAFLQVTQHQVKHAGRQQQGKHRV